jgi:hypothetical protein
MLEIYTELSRLDHSQESAEPIHIGSEPPRVPAFLVKNLNS